MRKFFVFAIILLVLSLPLASTAKAGGTINIYYAGSSDSQVHRALVRHMPKLTFVDDPSNAEVFVLNGVIPDNKIIAHQVQSGTSGLVLFLGPDIRPEQILTLLGNGDTISLIQTNNPASLQTVQNADPHTDSWLNSWMGDIDWATAPEAKDRFIISLSATSFTPLVENSVDHSLILGYTPPYDFYGTRHKFIFVFTPFLGSQNVQIQNWKYFDYLVSVLVSVAGQHSVPPYEWFTTLPTPTPTSSSVSENIYMPIATTAFLLFLILIIGIVLLLRRKRGSSKSGRA